MSILQILQEASALSIEDIKKALKKDAHASVVLRVGAKLEDVVDKDKFLTSIKFHVFNNDEVKKFVASRDNVKDVSLREFSTIRTAKSSELDEKMFDTIVGFTKKLFKEHGTVVKGSMSAELKKLLNGWFNTSGQYYVMPPWAEKELTSIPGIKPAGKIVLYRGVLFGKNSLEERTKYDGTLEIGNGLKFLKSIRSDKKTVDLEWDRPSSWSKDKDVAIRFAKYAPAQSQFSAMSGWLARAGEKREIDGMLGYVISIHADPDDVLIDTEKFNANFHMKHGDEREVILKPGEYQARIVKKYTVAGEVDPTASAPVTHQLDEVFADALALATSLDMGIAGTAAADAPHTSSYYSINTLRNIKDFTVLASKGATTASLHNWQHAIDFYNEKLSTVNVDDLRPDNFLGDDTARKNAKLLLQAIEWFSGKVTHSKFDNSKLSGPRTELTAEEYRTTLKSNQIQSIEPALLIGSHVTGGAVSALSDIAKFLNVPIPSAGIKSAAKQQELISAIIPAFFDKLNLEQTDISSDKRTFINVLKIAYRNAVMINSLLHIKDILSGIDTK